MSPLTPLTGCGDACPWMPGKHFIDWTIPDPKHMEPEEFNKARTWFGAWVWVWFAWLVVCVLLTDPAVG